MLFTSLPEALDPVLIRSALELIIPSHVRRNDGSSVRLDLVIRDPNDQIPNILDVVHVIVMFRDQVTVRFRIDDSEHLLPLLKK
jgi:hypothetical protein